MSDRASQTWSEYRPSKAVWFWSMAGAVVLTMIVGFTWGGWVTGGTSRELVETAAEDATAELAAAICMHRFLDAPNASAKLAELKEADYWDRDDLVEDAGWATFAAMERPVDGAASLCAEKLAEAELPMASTEEVREVPIAN